jgi:hypothetical protein
MPACALFARLISHPPSVLFSQNKSATNNQPAVLFSQNKPAPAISHQPTEQADGNKIQLNSKLIFYSAGNQSVARGRTRIIALFVWLISHQPAVLFSQNKPATSNQPAVLFSQNKSAPAISHQPNEQAAYLQPIYQYNATWNNVIAYTNNLILRLKVLAL